MPVEASSLSDRLDAVELWPAEAKRLVVGTMAWEQSHADLRALAVNYILRRQLEALDATVTLVRADLGHLAVTYVRPALDELLWLAWLDSIPQELSNQLLSAMGRSDAIRSLLAQRAYAGEAAMNELWYPSEFLDAVAAEQPNVAAELRALREQLSWAGTPLPNAAWVAQQTGRSDLYNYLHAATSRALHFSMGDVMRNAWGQPGGIVTTRKFEFQRYRAAFALYQLPVLFLRTAAVAAPYFEQAAVTSSGEMHLGQDILTAAELVANLGRVPLVHASEWNLTPDGPLKT